MVKVRPATNGVRIGPRRPVTPAIPMAAMMAPAARASSGPMPGTRSRAADTATPMAARRATAAAEIVREGTPTTTASTSQLPAVRCTLSRKSAVKVKKLEWLTGTVMVGKVMQILGVQTRPMNGMLTQILGRQKFRKLRSTVRVRLRA
jgi:hypothetical protein